MSKAAMAVARCVVVAAAITMVGNGTPMAQVQADMTSLDKELAPYLERYKLPAVAARGQGRQDRCRWRGRHPPIGTVSPLTVKDCFHIGSDTKAMTSLLAAILIEHPKAGDRVKLDWKTTVGGSTELLDKMAAGVKDITLEHLLSHQRHSSDREEHIPLLNYSVADDRANLDGMRAGLVARLVTMALTAVRPALRIRQHGLRAGRRHAGEARRQDLGGAGRRADLRAVADGVGGIRPAIEHGPGRCAARSRARQERTGARLPGGPVGRQPGDPGPRGNRAHERARLRDLGGVERHGRAQRPSAREARDHPQDAHQGDRHAAQARRAGRTPSSGGYGLGWDGTPPHA
jgi:hypothetical protein